MLFDTHAHYDDEAFDPDRREVLSALPQTGVGLVVYPGCTLTSSRKAVALAGEFPHVYAAVGVHPEDCHGFEPEQMERRRQLARPEGGGHRGDRTGLLLEGEPAPGPAAGGVPGPAGAGGGAEPAGHRPRPGGPRRQPGHRPGVPWGAGGVSLLLRQRGGRQAAGEAGLDLSFTGAITFKNARKAPEVIAAVPLERIMVETDAPYLTPVPFRGKRNDSGYVHLVAEKIAQLKGLPAKQVERQTWENGVRLFGIPQE